MAVGWTIGLGLTVFVLAVVIVIPYAVLMDYLTRKELGDG